MFFRKRIDKYSTYCIKELGFPDDVVMPKDEEKSVSKDSDEDSTVATMNDYCDDLDKKITLMRKMRMMRMITIQNRLLDKMHINIININMLL